MTTPSASTVPDVTPDVVPKVEANDTDEQWARTISMAVIEMLNDKKDKSSNGPVPDSYEDEKKKMLLLSLLKGKTNRWKITKQLKLFPEDDDPKTKKKTAEETWTSFKKRF
ncbi:hypothetical protein Moror_15753 [Moniliophthora roreri MCA 2997]|uniref:Uncharacterized protein n=2 Tax=Moniliophthora roreri TaxID=221103 RepID=V2W1Y5_MONRO|nr:hypothetical protein Moror_15753 [Moniliophthora roreri MCA 2997]